MRDYELIQLNRFLLIRRVVDTLRVKLNLKQLPGFVCGGIDLGWQEVVDVDTLLPLMVMRANYRLIQLSGKPVLLINIRKSNAGLFQLILDPDCRKFHVSDESAFSDTLKLSLLMNEILNLFRNLSLGTFDDMENLELDMSSLVMRFRNELENVEEDTLITENFLRNHQSLLPSDITLPDRKHEEDLEICVDQL